MDPGEQPEELKCLSYIEEQLIAQIHPIISVYRIRGNQYGYNGQIINFPQDLSTFTAQLQLPHTIHHLSNIVIIRREQEKNYKDFIVKRSHVENALKWLQTHNK